MKAYYVIALIAIALLSGSSVKTQTATLGLTDTITAARVTARTMFARITGTIPPIESQDLTNMENLIAAGKRFEAAKIATENDNFYNVTVRNLASTMSNRDLQVNVATNDFVATVIGNVRDHLNAKELLTGDYIYMGDPSKINGQVQTNFVNDVLNSNNHYISLDSMKVNLRTALKKVPQMIFSRSGMAVNHPEPAGLLTSRAFGSSHLRAGTNRRAVQFAFSQFLCINIDQMADSQGPTNMISQDVTRIPQGDPTIFDNKCRSCHTMLDGMRPAFAHFDYIDMDNTFVRNLLVLDANTNLGGTPGNNQIKLDLQTGLPQKYYSNKTVFPQGYVVSSTNWVNNATSGTDADFFGWRGNTTGSGIQTFAKMLADSQAFSRCMVKRVFQSVCNREPAVADKDLVSALAMNFEENNYRIKGLFEQVSARPECLGN